MTSRNEFLQTGRRLRPYLAGWVLFWSAAVAGAFVFNRLTGAGFRMTVLEGLFYFGLSGVLLFAAPVRAFLSGIAKPQRVVLTVFFFLLVLGQFVRHPRGTFPFPSWTMYGHTMRAKEAVYYAYHGILANGTSVSLHPVAVFSPSRFHRGMTGRLEQWIHKIEQERGDFAGKKKVLSMVLSALAKRYEHKHSGERVQAVEVIRCVLKTRPSGGRVPVKEMLWRFPLKDGEEA